MPSPFAMLLETMPFTGAIEALRLSKDKPFEDLSADEMREHVTLLPENTSFYVELPAIDPNLDVDAQPLWGFSYNAACPAEVGSIYCRVRDADNVGHHVADRVAWGAEMGAEPFKQEVRVKFRAGADLRLPLKREFVLWTFRIRGGRIGDDQSKLWRLESNLDTSLLVVFAFDIDPATGQVTRTDFEKVQDPTLREELREMSRAVKELLAGRETSPHHPDEEEDDVGNTPDSAVEEAPWGNRALRGDLWPETETGTPPTTPPTPVGLGGEVGESVSVATEPARVMVVFSFTTACERADFEPGAMVGFARCYPHLLVSATVPVDVIEASAHIDRPKSMSKWHEEGRNMAASCCKPPYDGWTKEIGALLTTDVNEKVNPIEPFPFWPNMFYYYVVDPFLAYGQRKYHIVNTERATARESGNPLMKREIVGPAVRDRPWSDVFDSWADYDGTVRKVARQGAFDNIHMAPRLRLMNVFRVVDPSSLNSARCEIDYRPSWHFDDIVMAPFCAHDCLHMHWRWGAFATKKWTHGWSAALPYSTPGAPQVPPEQDVWLWMRARTWTTYHVSSNRPGYVDGWHVLMHHGFGYAVSIQAAFKYWTAMQAVETFADSVFFATPPSSFYQEGGIIDASNSTAAYYWKARFYYDCVDGKAHPVERLEPLSAEALKQAIDL